MMELSTYGGATTNEGSHNVSYTQKGNFYGVKKIEVCIGIAPTEVTYSVLVTVPVNSLRTASRSSQPTSCSRISGPDY